MTYCEKMVAVVKVNGQILRERRSDKSDEILIPFGTEYSIRLKNLNSTRVAVSVHIDGDDALDGSRIVIDPNEEHELLGFMKSGVVRNRFKFIEKTQQISNYRGDKIDDGLIRIEYQFEKKPETYYAQYNNLRARCEPSLDLDTIKCSTFSHNDQGITVNGSQTHQAYQNTHLREMESAKHVITFSLKGFVESQTGSTKIEAPFYVKERVTCQTCGKQNKTINRFCPNCGTSLYS